MIHTDSTGTETASPANPLPDVPPTGGPGYAAFRPFPPVRGRPGIRGAWKARLYRPAAVC